MCHRHTASTAAPRRLVSHAPRRCTLIARLRLPRASSRLLSHSQPRPGPAIVDAAARHRHTAAARLAAARRRHTAAARLAALHRRVAVSRPATVVVASSIYLSISALSTGNVVCQCWTQISRVQGFSFSQSHAIECKAFMKPLLFALHNGWSSFTRLSKYCSDDTLGIIGCRVRGRCRDLQGLAAK